MTELERYLLPPGEWPLLALPHELSTEAQEVVRDVRAANAALDPQEIVMRLSEVLTAEEAHKGVREATQNGYLYFDPDMKLQLDVGYFGWLSYEHAIYDIIDDMLLAGRFRDFDLLLDRLSQEHMILKLTVEAILAFLTFAAQARDKLKNRSEFVNQAAKIIKKCEPDDFEDTMRGLW